MNEIRERIVAEARSWIGTPWAHQQREKGRAVDCAGFASMTGKNAGVSTFDMRDYERLPNGTMLGILGREMTRIPVSTMQPADVVAIAFNGEPMHIGIVTPYWHGDHLAIVHASNQRGKVCEHRIDPVLRRMIVAAFRYPGVPAD